MTPPSTELEVRQPTDKCNARKRKGGGYCSRPAGWGTDHPEVGRCKLHGGNVPNHRASAQKELARRGVEAFGLPLNIEPYQALLDELARTNGIILFYEMQIHALDSTADLTGPIGTEGTAEDTDLAHHPKSEAHIWVRLHQQERAHFVKVAETCVKAGIAERQIEIAEQQGAILATVIRGILTELKIAMTEEVRNTVRKHLMEVQTTTTTARELTSQHNGGN